MNSFQHLLYVLDSSKPYSRELRSLLGQAVVGGLRGRVARLTRGRWSRRSDENRLKYNGLAGSYLSHDAVEKPRVVALRGRLTVGSGREVRAHLCERLAERLEVAGAVSVLEAGCGDGNNLTFLRSRFPNMSLAGVDIAERRIEVARVQPGAEGIDFRCASVAKLPFPDRAFDVVFSVHCLEHLPREYPDALRECIRVARKRVILIEPVPEFRGPLQRFYAQMLDYLRGLPSFLEGQNIAIDHVELMTSGTNPFNLASLIEIPRDSVARSLA